MENVLKQFLYFQSKFKMKTSWGNILKLRVALQEMLAEDLQIAASSIALTLICMKYFCNVTA